MKKCIYLTEGECEEKLVKALKGKPVSYEDSPWAKEIHELRAGKGNPAF